MRVLISPTAALLRSLQWVSDRYVSHRDTAQIEGLLWWVAKHGADLGLLWWVAGHGADWLFCYGRLRGYGETP